MEDAARSVVEAVNKPVGAADATGLRLVAESLKEYPAVAVTLCGLDGKAGVLLAPSTIMLYVSGDSVGVTINNKHQRRVGFGTLPKGVPLMEGLNTLIAKGGIEYRAPRAGKS
jgi:hypothetical protein